MAGVLQVGLFVFLAGIGGTILIGLLSRNFQAVVNGIASIVAVGVPTLVKLGLALGVGADVTFGPELSLWIAVAGFLHMLGMLGWYDTVWWWDHLTHTLSAALVAALVYASLHTQYTLGSQVTDTYVAVFTVLFTLGVGVVWEFVELAAREVGEYIGKPPVLEYYGLRDTVLDMVFNGVGAIVVVAFDIRVFVSITEQIPRIMEIVVIGSTILLFVGALSLGIALDIARKIASNTG